MADQPQTQTVLESQTTSPPSSRRNVFRKPRSWRPWSRRYRNDLDRPIYPWWLTALTRGALCMLELSSLIYVVEYHKRMQEKGRNSSADAAMTGFAIGMALDALITVLSILGLYSDGILWSWFLDLIPAIICVLGALNLSPWESSSGPPDSLEYYREVSVSFALAVGVIHAAAVLVSFVGCCVLCARMSAADRAKKKKAKERAAENNISTVADAPATPADHSTTPETHDESHELKPVRQDSDGVASGWIDAPRR
ncbi:hypothetical protein VTJ49DRAFT_503 [Mycothermus thermophilus]|uniref:Uncharacterized protein n=1 Tax=Humicola insolens TaxID=85995 RepID=A0ABR3VFU5_HUMIN